MGAMRIKSLPMRAFAAVAISTPFGAPALAQDHSGHGGHMPAAAEQPPQDEVTPVLVLEHPPHSEVETDQPVLVLDHQLMQMGGCQSVGAHLEDGSINSGTVRVCRPVEASGTSRLPAAEGMMPGVHFGLGSGWMGMAHGYLWGIYTDQGGPRGDDKFYVGSMAMLTAEKDFGGARLQFKSMFSAEPLMDKRGYPNLFATGETADGVPLVDRQHPHDLFMELAVRVDADIAGGTTAFLYGGPVGEPALGPPAFMHRASAKLNPEAPITHHWFDSTHITYGVVTAGVAGRAWQVEVSAFRGQEPDEDRWDIETPELDSWSVRATLTPSPHWAAQVSYGRIEQPEALHPGEDEGRTTASVHYNDGHGFAATAAFSAKDRIPGPTLTAWMAEANWDIDAHHSVFGRIENVDNDELFPDHADPLHDQAFRVSKLQAGYAYTVPFGPFGLSLGGSVATFFKPGVLDAAYGDSPIGYTLFAKLALGH